jgi:phosphoribosylformimino-5-aminoimidazole carboxamide ribotide isomerase
MALTLYPAIDLKDGQCVRLKQGDFAAMTVYDPDPGARAAAFAGFGFNWLHVVDLDGALKGAGANGQAFADIRAAFPGQVQLGGGLRDMAGITRALALGADRVILGTIAARDPALVRAAAREWPGRVAVGIDAREGRVAVEGWLETTDVQALDLARAYADSGVAALIVTDISRDGLKTGVNVDLTGAMADAVDIPVIASGGVKGVQDITALRRWPGRAIHGAILGRALYDGDIDPAAAQALAAQPL